LPRYPEISGGVRYRNFGKMPRMPAEIPRDGRRLRRVDFQPISGIPLERKMYCPIGLGDFFQPM
jgi:hypothetical protein